MPTNLVFYASSDDRLHLKAEEPGHITTELPDEDDNVTDLDEVDGEKYGGWLIKEPDFPPYIVWAEYFGAWTLGVMMPDADGADIGSVSMTLRQSPKVCYSVEATVIVQTGTRVSLVSRGEF